MIISGPVLAPIAFTTMPVTVSPEIAQYAYTYAGTLFTLFFIQIMFPDKSMISHRITLIRCSFQSLKI